MYFLAPLLFFRKYVTQLSAYVTHSIYRSKKLLGDGLYSSVRTEYIINCIIEKVRNAVIRIWNWTYLLH